MAPNQITAWKKQLTESAAEAFEGASAGSTDMPGGQDPEMLFAVIGRMKMENDLLHKMAG